MKYLFFLPFFLLLACVEQTPRQEGESQKSEESTTQLIAPEEQQKMYDECWDGTLGDEIPVRVRYHQEAGFLVGSIIYLNTVNKTPIRLIGNVDKEGNISLKEYATDGNITGMIYGQRNGEQFNGSWNAPDSEKSYTVSLNRKDTLIPSSSIIVNPTKIPGYYHYQYGKKGYLGDVYVTVLENGLMNMELISLTKAPARNIAEVVVDSVHLSGTSFEYEIPDADSCAFQINFYKNFLTVHYTQGGCYSGNFGHNASLEGVYVKVDDE